ncbi:MAG: tRNA (guanosine(37)-N1)-methyltransferase TrmD [Candidatus Omnitrophota bacterium]
MLKKTLSAARYPLIFKIMRIDIITIFPKMFEPVLNESIIKRAQNKGKVEIIIHNLRDHTLDRHKKVDDRPFGGGSGMVMEPEPIFRAVEDIIKVSGLASQRVSGLTRKPVYPLTRKPKVILLTPQGKTLTQPLVKKLAKHKHLILICGHYEGIDERVRQYLADEEISVGDYILTGGELPAMVLTDAVTRLIPGVLGDKNSLNFESFEGNLLEYPQYTRPADFRGLKVPDVLLSGDHKKIEIWRKREAVKITKQKRPELLKTV